MTVYKSAMFKCSLCTKTFGKKSTRFAHEKSCRNLQKYSCSLCKQSFQNETKLNSHITRSHKKVVESHAEKTVTCQETEDDCSENERTLPTKTKVIKHTTQCNGTVTNLSCEICNAQKFKKDNELWKHVKEIHGSSNKSNDKNLCHESTEELKPKNRQCIKEQKYQRNSQARKGRQKFGKKTGGDNQSICDAKEGIKTQKLSDEIEPMEIHSCIKEHPVKLKQSNKRSKLKAKQKNVKNTTIEDKQTSKDKEPNNKIDKDDSCKSDGESSEAEAASQTYDNPFGRKNIFKCKTCNKVFSRKNELTKHGKKGCYSIETDGFCRYCKMTFSCNASLRRHIRRAHKETIATDNNGGQDKRATCNICSKEFFSKAHLVVHSKICLKLQEKRFCKFCKIKFCDASTLKRHLQRKHKDSIVSEDKTSARALDSEATFAPQQESNSKETLNDKISADTKLTDCDDFGNETYTKGVSRSKVTEIYNADQANETVCKILNASDKHDAHSQTEDKKENKEKILNNKGNSFETMYSEKTLEEKGFGCGVCKKIFTKFNALCVHMKVHTELRQCQICGEKFERGRKWKSHIKTHKSSEKLFCHICGFSYESASGYSKHMKKHEGKFYPCQICGKRFTANHSLKDHMLIHKGEKPFICEICGGRFSQKAHLLRHSRTHTGERKYQCGYCQKRFIDSSGLLPHLRIHQGIKPHECNLCNRKFVQMSALKTHKKTHFMKRDFQCDVCERKFTTKNSLLRHRQMHEKDKTIKKQAYATKPTLFCDKCPKGFISKRGLARHTQKHTKGILPVLQVNDLNDSDNDQSSSVTALISSVHGHYQTATEPGPAENISEQMQSYVNKQEANINGYVTIENVEKPISNITSVDYQNLKSYPQSNFLGNVNAEILNHQVKGGHTGNNMYDNQIGNQHIVVENVPVDSTRTDIFQNVTDVPLECVSVLTTETNSDSTYSFTADLKMVNENVYNEVTVITHTGNEQGDGFHSVYPEGNGVIIEIKEIEPMPGENIAVSLADPTYGLNTLSNVVCNLEEGPPSSRLQATFERGTGWESIKFSQSLHAKSERQTKEAENEASSYSNVKHANSNVKHAKSNLKYAKADNQDEMAFPEVLQVHVAKMDDDIREGSEAFQPNHYVLKDRAKQDCLEAKDNIQIPDSDKNRLTSESHARDVDIDYECIDTNKIDTAEETLCLKKEVKQSRTTCEICSVSFTSEKSLRRHSLQHHSGVRTNSENTQKHDSSLQEAGQLIVVSETSQIPESGVRKESQSTVDSEISQKSDNVVEEDSLPTVEMQCMKCNETFKTVALLKNHWKESCNRQADEEILVTNTENEDESLENLKTTALRTAKTLQNRQADEEILVTNTENEDESSENLNATALRTAKTLQSFGHSECTSLKLEESTSQVQDEENIKEDKDNKTDSKSFKCKVCNKKFVYMSSLKCHEKRHTGSAPYICEICGENFYKLAHMKRHLARHDKNNEGVYSCDKCGKVFLRESLLKRHSLTHLGLNPYRCTLCHKSFKYNSNLTRHMKSHPDGSKDISRVHSHFCALCGKGYTTLASLQIHMNSHTGQRPFVCDICGSTFSQSGHLQRHLKSHSGVKSMKCEICGKSFYDAGGLRVHMRSHTGDKPYECKVCHKSFSQVQNLRTHERKHQNLQQFVCDQCNQPFTTKMALQRHEQRHKREQLLDEDSKKQRYMTVKKMNDKVVPCPNCDRLFTTRKSMLAHGRQYCSGAPRVTPGTEPGVTREAPDQYCTVSTSASGMPVIQSVMSSSNIFSKRSASSTVIVSAVRDSCRSASVPQPGSDTVVIIPETVQTITKPLSSNMQVETSTQEFINSVAGHNDINADNVMRSPKKVTTYIEEDAEMSIVHVVEQYSNAVNEEDPCQSSFDSRTDIDPSYNSDSIQFANMQPMVAPNSENIFVTSSLVPPVSVTHSLTPVPASNVMAPIFAPSVLGVPLNLVTLGSISNLQIDPLQQDPYYLQEPHWR